MRAWSCFSTYGCSIMTLCRCTYSRFCKHNYSSVHDKQDYPSGEKISVFVMATVGSDIFLKHVQENEAGTIASMLMRSWRQDGRTYIAEMPTSADSKNSCVANGSSTQWLERRTREWKVVCSNFCRSGGRIFFSRVDFLCWLLYQYPFHPRVTTVARKKSRSFCQKCMWEVTAKHAYTLRMWLLLNRASALVTTCP